MISTEPHPFVQESARTNKGQSLFELLAGLSILTPVFLVLLDLGLLVAASQTNASICREAARAAASGNPKQAAQRAELILDSVASSIPGTQFKLLPPVRLDISNKPEEQITPIDGELINPGGPIQGEVLVTTEANVKPILLQYLYGSSAPIKLRTEQSSPIRFIEPSRNCISRRADSEL